MSPVPASALTIDDNPTNALARRLRAHLQALATLRLPITYREVAKELLLLPPNTIHQVTEALEQIMAEDAAADRPFIAAMIISYFAVPAASQAAMALASASPSDWAGIGIGPHTPELPDLILPAR